MGITLFYSVSAHQIVMRLCQIDKSGTCIEKSLVFLAYMGVGNPVLAISKITSALYENAELQLFSARLRL